MEKEEGGVVGRGLDEEGKGRGREQQDHRLERSDTRTVLW